MATNNAWNTEYIRGATYTPVLSFGGGTTGITYSTQTGEYFTIGTFVWSNITIILTNKGSSTGTASITLPVAANVDAWCAIVPDNLTFAGFVQGFISGSGVTILSYSSGGTATALTDAEFANNTVIRMSMIYSRA
jgi:hypothetical protein